ncbi:CHAT domain-containing protein [Halorussus salinus]|uniref:hypothetical protein n=1 Tax=Halorussus salinus TaxID=1364935 RepID=UPI00138F6C4D|nr:hypothetical protein [Halorussus salinus]
MSTQPTFSPLSDATGLDIVDPIETRHFSLLTDSPVTPTAADTDRFAFPVATACRITTGRFAFPYMVPMEVRTPEGDHLASIDLPTTREFSDDEYLLELHSPIKVYLRATGGMTIDASDDAVAVEFDGEVSVAVGARSYHSSPAATITVPDDPEAVMAAVSAFPSALKTTSPERAWPTLRGHPPRVERGEELSIPDALETPDTGIEIAVPPEYGHVYTVAPLAYYLGAEVVPGETARLTADSGVNRFLGEDVAAVGEEVEAILKRVFLLDCVTRTEGLYPDELHERELLESVGEFDFEALYEASPADRLAAYLAVDDDAFAAIESPWHRVTHVEADPGPDAAELLPYVVNDLSLVRVKPGRDEAWSPSESQQETNEALNAFVRSPGGADDRSTAGESETPTTGESKAPAADESRPPTAAAGEEREDFLRSASLRRSTRRSQFDELEDPDAGDGEESGGDGAESDGDGPENASGESGNDADAAADPEEARGVPGEGGYMPLPETDALEQAWIGDRTPVEGTKLLKPAFEHESAASEDGTVEITVACNDEQMRSEWDSAAEIYADRDDLRASVTCEFGVTTERLRDLLAEETDMFHFVGHIDGLGFQCSDGVLDAAAIEETGATTVLLNGCRSHDQGVALVEAGASAAVVSLGDLWNEGAVEVGETLAGLFRHGFSIGHAMTIVREHTSLGKEYVVVGSPSVTLCQSENGIPFMYHIFHEGEESESFEVQMYSYPMWGFSIGGTIVSYLPQIERHHVAIGECGKGETTMDQFKEILESYPEPLLVNGELTWSDVWAGI